MRKEVIRSDQRINIRDFDNLSMENKQFPKLGEMMLTPLPIFVPSMTDYSFIQQIFTNNFP